MKFIKNTSMKYWCEKIFKTIDFNWSLHELRKNKENDCFGVVFFALWCAFFLFGYFLVLFCCVCCLFFFSAT